jgi:hypothetical protein
MGGMTLQALGGVNLPCGWYHIRGQSPSTGGRDHTLTHRDNEHNNQIKIDNLGGKQVLDNRRRGDDGQHEASGATDNMMRRGGGGQRKTSGWQTT